jgi:hypothetical protein
MLHVPPMFTHDCADAGEAHKNMGSTERSRLTIAAPLRKGRDIPIPALDRHQGRVPVG